jgi:SAM-dependent methyltransferase
VRFYPGAARFESPHLALHGPSSASSQREASVDSLRFFRFVGRERDATNSELELGQRDCKTPLGFEMFERFKRLWTKNRPVPDDDFVPAVPPAEFDEATYLNKNPDVAAKVENTPGYSGWRHFVEQGYLENRGGVSAIVCDYVQTEKNDPINRVAPPVHLRRRVHGADDRISFDSIGRIVADTLFEYLEIDDNIAHFRALDFGVGCGRVLVPLDKLCRRRSSFHARVQWYGSDIDREAIAWCQRCLAPVGEFVVNDPTPPLPFDDQFFDFIFSISVFTHLPEDMQFAWLAELHRVLKVGGTAILSTLPMSLAGKGVDESKLSRGFYYSPGGKGTKGLPGFYQDAFHNRQYIEREWSRYFLIQNYKESGIAGHQDLILCRRVS